MQLSYPTEFYLLFNYFNFSLILGFMVQFDENFVAGRPKTKDWGGEQQQKTMHRICNKRKRSN